MKTTRPVSNDKSGEPPILSQEPQAIANLKTDFPRASDIGILCTEAATSLFERSILVPHEDIIGHILLQHTLEMVFRLRLVSKGCYSITSNINQYFILCTLLSQKAIVSFRYIEIFPQIELTLVEKYDFAIDQAGIDIAISFDDFMNQSLDLAERLKACSNLKPRITLTIKEAEEFDKLQKLFKSNQFNADQQLIFSHAEIILSVLLTDYINQESNLMKQVKIFSDNHFVFMLKIEDADTLGQLCDLVSNSQCSEDQQLILKQTQFLYITDDIEIDNDTVANFNQLLGVVGSQLKWLTCYATVSAPLTLSNFSKIEKIEFGYINSDLTVKNLSMLKELCFDHIPYSNATTTLEDLPELIVLSFQNVGSKLSLSLFPKLTTLSFLDINIDLLFPSYPRLETISFGEIGEGKTVILSEYPKLTKISFMDIKEDSCLVLRSSKYLDFIEGEQGLERVEVYDAKKHS